MSQHDELGAEAPEHNTSDEDHDHQQDEKENHDHEGQNEVEHDEPGVEAPMEDLASW